MEILRGLVSLISLLNYILFYCLHHNDLKTLQIGFICITLLTEHHQQIDGSCNLQATLPWEQLWSSWTHWQRSHDQNRFVSSRTGTKTAVNVGGWAYSNQTWGHLCNKSILLLSTSELKRAKAVRLLGKWLSLGCASLIHYHHDHTLDCLRSSFSHLKREDSGFVEGEEITQDMGTACSSIQDWVQFWVEFGGWNIW